MNPDDLTWVWLAGCAIALAVFAGKTGLGLAARMFSPESGIAAKWLFLLMACAVYALLFALIPVVDRLLPQEDWTQLLTKAAGYGIAAHCAMGAGLVAWGLLVLTAPRPEHDRCFSVSSGRWMLVLPCPVCALVIVAAGLTGSRLLGVSAGTAALLLGGTFLALVLTLVLLLLPWQRRIAAGGTGFLGSVMTAAGIFILALLAVSPLFKEAKDVYALACRQNADSAAAPTHMVPLFIACAVLISVGVWGFWRKLRKESLWTR